MKFVSPRRVLPALALVVLSVAPAAALDPEEFMRPCKRHDLIGLWRVMRLGVVGGGEIDRTDPAFLPHQRYVFHSNATMAYATQEVPFSPDEQRGLLKVPPAWLEREARRPGEGHFSLPKPQLTHPHRRHRLRAII